MLTKLIIIGLATVSAFFNPSVKLSSGRTATLNGRGPPVLFSTGLFGTMPQQFYNEIIKNLKHNLTIVTMDGTMPITPKVVVDLADSLKVDKLAYIGHSSFNPEILETGRINNAVLVDPIVLPNLDINGILSGGLNNIDGRTVTTDFPTLIIKSEKLYQSKLDLPTWQELEINGYVQVETYDGVGHPDILDDRWANLAKSTELWGTAQGKSVPFKEWKLDNKNTIPAIRKEYRNYISSRVLKLINNEPIVLPPLSSPLHDHPANKEVPFN